MNTENTPARPVKKILFVLFTPIGDVLFASPMIAGVRRAYPHAEITVAVNAAIGSFFDMSPDVDKILIIDPARGPTDLQKFFAAVGSIRPHQYDIAIGISAESNFYVAFSGARKQIWQRLPVGFWLWGPLDDSYQRTHAVLHYWRIVARLGVFPQTAEDLIPKWSVPPSDTLQAQQIISANGVTAAKDCPVIFLHPGAIGYGKLKRWPAENFAALANRLIDTLNAVIVVLGSHDDTEAETLIMEQTANRAISLVGKTSLRMSIAAISLCDIYIGNDSGLTHFAVAMGKPTIALFGVSNINQFKPCAQNPELLELLEPIPPRKPIGHFIGTEPLVWPKKFTPDNRMADISVDRVFASAMKLAELRSVERK